MTKKEKDIKGVIRRQRYYSTLAEKEGKDAVKRMQKEKKANKPEMAKDSKQEAKICFAFSKLRKKIANKQIKKLGKK